MYYKEINRNHLHEEEAFPRVLVCTIYDAMTCSRRREGYILHRAVGITGLLGGCYCFRACKVCLRIVNYVNDTTSIV